jgi:protein arginine kinase activator
MKSPASVCHECGKTAQVHVTWVKAGQTLVAAFCEEHAAAAGVLDPHGYALLESLGLAPGATADGAVRCPVCDCSQRDFERQGRLGCPACYGAFAGLLPSILSRIHRGSRHRGKFPRRRMDPVVVRHRLAQLQTELRDAVRDEHFEGAAQTREAIAALKAKLPAPAPAVLPEFPPSPPAS